MYSVCQCAWLVYQPNTKTYIFREEHQAIKCIIMLSFIICMCNLQAKVLSDCWTHSFSKSLQQYDAIIMRAITTSVTIIMIAMALTMMTTRATTSVHWFFQFYRLHVSHCEHVLFGAQKYIFHIDQPTFYRRSFPASHYQVKFQEALNKHTIEFSIHWVYIT